MADWYYFQGGSQQGPVGDDQLRGMVASGQLAPTDSVWCNGMANWAPISSVPELKPASAPRSAPAPGPGPAPAPAPAYQDDYDYAPRPAASGGKLISIWSIILLSGAGLWFLNAFLPWISSPYIMGIQYGAGIFAFIMSILILGSIIPSFFVSIMAEWRWTAAFFFALMGLIILILGFVAFSYSNSVGPWIHLLATLIVMGGAITEGVFGLLAFLAKLKTQQSKR